MLPGYQPHRRPTRLNGGAWRVETIAVPRWSHRVALGVALLLLPRCQHHAVATPGRLDSDRPYLGYARDRMENLNDNIGRVIPELTHLARDVDAPDGLIHVAADVLVNPVWDDAAPPLSADPAKMRETRQRLWRVVGERVAGDDPRAAPGVGSALKPGQPKTPPVAFVASARGWS